MWPDHPFVNRIRSLLAQDGPDAQPAQRGASPPHQLLRRLDWHLMRPLASSLGGSECSPFLGPGVEFSEIRAYQPGDDIRFIDWNISARSEQPVLRQAYVERAADVWFLLDLSASTRWGTADCLKVEQAFEFVTLAGQLLNRAGNRLGALLFAAQPLAVIPPSVGQLHLQRLLLRARGLQLEGGEIASGPTDLVGALTKARAIMRRRALVIIVSDFLVAADWQPALSRFAQRHEVVAVRLVDPREGSLPDIGAVTLEDPETGQQLYVDTTSARLRERFAQAARQQSEQLRVDLLKCGAELLQISTDEDVLSSLVRFLQTRRARNLYKPRHKSQTPAALAASGKGDER